MLREGHAARRPSLRVRLFGLFEVEADGRTVAIQAWERPKARLLVQCLAIARDRRLHRERLMEALWPHLDPENAARQLSKALHHARRALEPDLAPRAMSRFLVADGKELALGAEGDVWVDADEFERLAEHARSEGDVEAGEAALALARGDLLAGEPYEEWTLARRERLRGLRRELLSSLAGAYAERGAIERAVALLSDLVSDDPTNEAAHRDLMKLYAGAGRRHLALEQYRVCKGALARELDVDVEEVTEALYARIASGEFTSASATGEPPPEPQIVDSARPAALRIVAPRPAIRPAPAATRRPWIAVALALALLCVGIVPAAASSAEVRRRLGHTMTRVRANIAQVRGHEPRLMTLVGRVSLAGARVEAVDSVSGWATLAAPDGRFRLPDLLWYPGAHHELVISDEHGAAERVQITAPAALPADGRVDVGEIAFAPDTTAQESSAAETNAVSLLDADAPNAAYYRGVVDGVTSGLDGDDARVDAVCRYVHARYDPTRAATAEPLGTRRTLERGSSQSGDLSFAMADLLYAAGYDVRLVNITDSTPSEPHAHMLVEVSYGGAGHVFDPTFGPYPTASHPSYVELRVDPSALRASSPPWLADAFASGVYHTYRFREG